MAFIPFGFMAGAKGNPVSDFVFGLDFGAGMGTYSGTGNTFYDVSQYRMSGSFVDPAEFTYSNGRYIEFNAVTDSNLRFGDGVNGNSQLAYDSDWSFFIYWEPQQNTASYLFDKSYNGIDKNSLVYGYNSEAARPWNGGYRNMTEQTQTVGTLGSLAFTKSSAATNNYKAYVNGTNTTTVSSTFNVSTENRGVNFNKQNAISWHLYNWYIYDRALTASEVSQIHNYVTNY